MENYGVFVGLALSISKFAQKANEFINGILKSLPDTDEEGTRNIETGKVKLMYLNNVYDSREINSEWVYGRMNLFGTSLYYAQNGMSQETADTSDDQIIKAEMAKAYLWLHTIPFDYDKLFAASSFFRNGNQPSGGIESLPYLYIVFIGALLWRRNYHSSTNTDPIVIPPPYNSLVYRPDKSFLFKTPNGYKLCLETIIGTNVPLDVNSFIDINVDSHITNTLITIFKQFVSQTWPAIEKMFEPCIVQNGTNLPRPIYFQDIIEIASAAKKYADGKCRELKRVCFNEGLEVGGGKFILTNTKFDLILPYNKANIMLFPYMTNDLFRVITHIYKASAYVLTTGFVGMTQPAVTNVPKNFAKSYINEFVSVLDTLSMKALVNERAGYPVDSSAKQLRDFHIAMYMYFKNLWDKWLSGYYYSNETISTSSGRYPIQESFKVENYFSNFMFMDSFYRNIFKRLKLNCGTLYEHYVNKTNNYSMFSYLGSVASSHQCMFLSIPDYVNLGDNDDTVAYNNLADLFRPMPANTVPPPQMENKFIVMYTHQPSSVTTVDKSDFRVDSFDIWSESDGTNVVPAVFKKTDMPKDEQTPATVLTKKDVLDEQINRYGYNVPAFGVAYSRQNNSIFKSVKASMDNPVMTEQAVLAMGAIAELGNSTKKKVCFYGQDIYPIYSNYSYTIEVELMGNAQIQPLMYFQLMNIPMYRGTYMIISVTHSMTQGDMTTTIRATKMSKYATPFVSNWFTLPSDYEDANNDALPRYNSQLIAENGTVMDVTDCKFANTIKDVYGIKYHWGGKSVETGFDCSGFTHYVYRKAYNVDITEGTSTQLNKFRQWSNEGKATLVQTSIVKGNHDELPKKAVCGDILFLGKAGDSAIKHVALYMGRVGDKQYIAESSGTRDRETPGVVCRDTADSSLSQYEVKYVGHYNHTPDNSACFIADGQSVPEAYDGTLATVKITDQERMSNGYRIMDRLINQGFKLNNKMVKLTPMQAAAIAGVWFQESKWNPQAVNSSSKAYGLAQWLGDRKYKNYKAYCTEKGISGGKDATAMKSVDEQMNYAEWEFNRDFYKVTCHLWGEDASYRNEYGYLCGNMMIYKDDMGYDDNKLYQLVYRFTVGYEDLKAPSRSEFLVKQRAEYAKTAYELYMNRRVTGEFLVNYPPQRKIRT